MNSYCTYFDRGYLAAGLALWRSLVRHDPAACLWVLALDDDAAAVLRAEGAPGLRVLTLPELLAADPELAAVRGMRPHQEFIFTLTPCLVRHLLRTLPEGDTLAYLDADLWFFSSPAPIWDELAQGSVLAVPHRFPAWHDDSARYGRFNVGVLGFRADANGRACVDWWRERCLASCALVGDGSTYGDQKYLDEWPERFGRVVVSRHPGINVAPWNWLAHRFALRPGGVEVDGRPLVVFHFAQLRRIDARWCDSGQMEYGIMPLRLRSRIYGPYLDALDEAEEDIRFRRPEVPLLRRSWSETLGPWHLRGLRLGWGQCWRRVGPWCVAGRGGLGRFSGRFLAIYRRLQRRGAP